MTDKGVDRIKIRTKNANGNGGTASDTFTVTVAKSLGAVSRVILPEVAHALTDQAINAIGQRVRQGPGNGGGGAGLAGLQVDVNQLRLSLEASRAFALPGGGRAQPVQEVGMRHDGGDGKTGSGAEVVGGLRYDASACGAPAGDTQALWGPQWLSAEDGVVAVAQEARVEASLGYGLAVPGGLLTPYSELALGESGRRHRLGCGGCARRGSSWRWRASAPRGLASAPSTPSCCGGGCFTSRASIFNHGTQLDPCISDGKTPVNGLASLPV